MKILHAATFFLFVAACGIAGPRGDGDLPAAGIGENADGANPPARPLAIVGADVLYDPVDEPILDAAVLIRDGRVTAMGPADRIDLPDDARVIDADGLWLIPGLWDMHVHLTQATELALPVLLANGVTGVRDMGGELSDIEAMRRRVRTGEVAGPRIFRPGPLVDGPKDGFDMHRIIVRTAEEGRAAADSVKALGGDFIKVHNGVPAEAYFALIERAHQIGMEVTGHIPVTVDPAAAIRAGHQSIEHFVTFFEGTLREKVGGVDALRGYIDDGLDTLVHAAAASGAYLDPTVYVYLLRARRGELADDPDPRQRYIADSLRDYWETFFPVREQDRNPQVAEIREAFYRLGLDVVGRFHDAGVPLVAGTDLAGRDILPGFHLHDELAALVEAGLTPAEALASGTTVPASLLDADSLGAIAVGNRADMVLLDRDPRADISNTRRIRAVVADGRYYGRAALDGLLEGVAAEAR